MMMIIIIIIVINNFNNIMAVLISFALLSACMLQDTYMPGVPHNNGQCL